MTTLGCTLVLATAVSGAGDGQEYRYVPDVDRYVGYVRNYTLYVGRLDADGGFHQLHAIEASKEPADLRPIIYFGPGYDDLLDGDKLPRKCYEFRSGRLIPGKLGENGVFVPDEGGVVVNFKNYKYKPNSVQIWNLPGRFEAVKPQIEGRK